MGLQERSIGSLIFRGVVGPASTEYATVGGALAGQPMIEVAKRPYLSYVVTTDDNATLVIEGSVDGGATWILWHGRAINSGVVSTPYNDGAPWNVPRYLFPLPLARIGIQNSSGTANIVFSAIWTSE